jgi:hypothetical protein
MTKIHSRHVPYLAVRPDGDGDGWYVEAKWVGRAKEQLGRFETYSEARDWVALESTSYFVLREIESTVRAARAIAKADPVGLSAEHQNPRLVAINGTTCPAIATATRR